VSTTTNAGYVTFAEGVAKFEAAVPDRFRSRPVRTRRAYPLAPTCLKRLACVGCDSHHADAHLPPNIHRHPHLLPRCPAIAEREVGVAIAWARCRCACTRYCCCSASDGNYGRPPCSPTCPARCAAAGAHWRAGRQPPGGHAVRAVPPAHRRPRSAPAARFLRGAGGSCRGGGGDCCGHPS
jgi:hypothetical protein